MFGFHPRNYDLKVELSSCCQGLGSVYLAQTNDHNQRPGQYVCVKKYRMDKASKEETSMIHEEILTLRQFHHANIQSFFTSFVHGSELYLISPLMCFGSCKDTIRNCFNTGFPEILISLIMRDVLNALEYLHARGYIHRAIRASHILLCQTKAVLSGFRDSTNLVAHGERVKVLHQMAPFSKSSLNWLAPEVLEQNLIGYNEKSDIYSIGITCCELANGVEPYGEAQPTYMFTEKVRGNVPTLLDRTTCPATEDILEINEDDISDNCFTAQQAQRIYCQRAFSDEFHQFSEICMEKRASNRWSAKQLLSHAFFKQCRHTDMSDQLHRFGLEISDYSEIRDDSLALSKDMSQLNVDGHTWEWDF